MRYLTIVRHAKAADPDAWDDDFDRPLLERGTKDALLAAKMLANLQPPIDCWIASAAQRARQTTSILTSALDEEMDADVLYSEQAYLATLDTLLEIVRAAPVAAQHIALIGHNPGLEELIAALCAGDAKHLNFRLPTAAFAHIELQIAHWEQLRPGSGELRYLVAPKMLRK